MENFVSGIRPTETPIFSNGVFARPGISCYFYFRFFSTTMLASQYTSPCTQLAFTMEEATFFSPPYRPAVITPCPRLPLGLSDNTRPSVSPGGSTPTPIGLVFFFFL